MVDMMLEHGVFVGTTNDAGETPLHIAAALGHVAVAEHLMAAGADATIADFGGDDAVDIFGNRRSAFLMIEGRSSFERAVEGGHVDVVVMMIGKGVCVTTRASRALLFAGTGAMVDALVAAGCSVRDSNGNLALMTACKKGNVGVMQALFWHSVKEDRMRTRIELEEFAAFGLN
jgi:ankyrin repeat protein